MYNVHLFGEGTDTFSNIFTEYNYNNSDDYDFDVYVTTHFHGNPCDIRDLKTNKLIIFNNDVCHSLKGDLFPSINEFLNQSDKKIKCLVTATHYIIEELSEDFDYCYYSQTTNELSENTATRDLPILFGRDVSLLRQKKFLSFNKRVQKDRKALYQFLRDNDFLKDGWVSYNPHNQFPDEDSLILDNVDYDKDAENRGMADWNMGLYMTSYFSIITETQFDFGENEDILSVNFSEKVFKTILGMHPFFLLAQPKALFALKKLGFKTFGDYWDESYDDEENDGKRMERCFDSIKKFLVNDIQYIHRKLSSVDWIDSIGKILEHNFNHFFVHNNRQRKNLETKIQNLVLDRDLLQIVESTEFRDKIRVVNQHTSEFNLVFTLSLHPMEVYGHWDCSTLSQYQIVDALFKKHGYDKSQWIFFTNNLREDIKWNSNVEVVDPHAPRVFHLLTSRLENMKSKIEYDFFTTEQLKILKTHTKSHIFSCYNRAPRKHRVLCIDEILSRNIEERGLISFVCGDDERPHGTDNLMDYIKSFGLSDKTNKYFETSPHILDLQPHEEDDNKCIIFNFDDVKNTFFNLVTETFFYEKDSLMISEKTYKFLPFHPMIILGQPYTLKHLRKLGFKTFPEMFDESYDEIEDDNERFFTVMDQVEKLCHEPYETLYERYVKCFDSMLHNQKVIKKKYTI